MDFPRLTFPKKLLNRLPSPVLLIWILDGFCVLFVNGKQLWPGWCLSLYAGCQDPDVSWTSMPDGLLNKPSIFPLAVLMDSVGVHCDSFWFSTSLLASCEFVRNQWFVVQNGFRDQLVSWLSSKSWSAFVR